MNGIYDVAPMLEAYARGEKGRVAWELCKLSAFMDGYAQADLEDVGGDNDEQQQVTGEVSRV